MSTSATGFETLDLNGDWTVEGVAEQFSGLVRQLTLLSGNRTHISVPPLGIDLRGISSLDACGCQLLVQFFRALQNSGLAPRFINLSDPLADTIRQLGFAREISQIQ